ncbi:hypothetical protein BDK51DRAFT_50876 [Blyttiomyces helicus]|uniref:Uncharacterized protein n=1 Tax=Blyttiomyces helicus TaxID=388810 RepID=A0A4P9W4X0_9FUNG|nr:hypothetical protein BDK51DRAFT_50876 [Blyttiomyces helicus]|eukprot:RKO86343.1 hypothetical protein BDK51DRAFT_50876 [Blyttiomyces helicus]
MLASSQANGVAKRNISYVTEMAHANSNKPASTCTSGQISPAAALRHSNKTPEDMFRGKMPSVERVPLFGSDTCALIAEKKEEILSRSVRFNEQGTLNARPSPKGKYLLLAGGRPQKEEMLWAAVAQNVDFKQLTKKQVRCGPSPPEWEGTMHAEIRSMFEKGVFTLVKVPEGKKAVGTNGSNSRRPDPTGSSLA